MVWRTSAPPLLKHLQLLSLPAASPQSPEKRLRRTEATEGRLAEAHQRIKTQSKIARSGWQNPKNHEQQCNEKVSHPCQRAWG